MNVATVQGFPVPTDLAYELDNHMWVRVLESGRVKVGMDALGVETSGTLAQLAFAADHDVDRGEAFGPRVTIVKVCETQGAFGSAIGLPELRAVDVIPPPEKVRAVDGDAFSGAGADILHEPWLERSGALEVCEQKEKKEKKLERWGHECSFRVHFHDLP